MSVDGDNFIFVAFSSSQVAAAAASTQLLGSNPQRKAINISNASPNIMFVRFGAAATSANFHYQIAAGANLPLVAPLPTGTINAMWASGSTNSPPATSGSAMCLDIS